MKHKYATKHTVPAKGTRGCLITDYQTGKKIFRVYTKNHEFVDYELNHADLEVIIVDTDATFYKNNAESNEGILDHSPETLGVRVKKTDNTPERK